MGVLFIFGCDFRLIFPALIPCTIRNVSSSHSVSSLRPLSGQSASLRGRTQRPHRSQGTTVGSVGGYHCMGLGRAIQGSHGALSSFLSRSDTDWCCASHRGTFVWLPHGLDVTLWAFQGSLSSSNAPAGSSLGTPRGGGSRSRLTCFAPWWNSLTKSCQTNRSEMSSPTPSPGCLESRSLVLRSSPRSRPHCLLQSSLILLPLLQSPCLQFLVRLCMSPTLGPWLAVSFVPFRTLCLDCSRGLLFLPLHLLLLLPCLLLLCLLFRLQPLSCPGRMCSHWNALLLWSLLWLVPLVPPGRRLRLTPP